MGQKVISTYSYEAYLAMEIEAGVKHEYHDGLILAMSGGSLAHGQISMNFGTGINNALRKAVKPCSTFSSDVRVRIDATQCGFYPDLSVVFGPPETSAQDPNGLTNPVLIVEVLSESTAAFDRGAKFAHYRRLASLKEYVLISQEEIMVDSFYRQEDGAWMIQTITDLEAMLSLSSLGVEVPMREIYQRVVGIDQLEG